MAGSAHLYSLVLLACIILGGAELFGGGHLLDIPFLLCALVLFPMLVLVLYLVWGLSTLPWRPFFSS
jgi:hypothetical protein